MSWRLTTKEERNRIMRASGRRATLRDAEEMGYITGLVEGGKFRLGSEASPIEYIASFVYKLNDSYRIPFDTDIKNLVRLQNMISSPQFRGIVIEDYKSEPGPEFDYVKELMERRGYAVIMC